MTLTIRKAAATDAAGILACLRAAFGPYQANYAPAAFEDTVLTETSLALRMNTMTVFVAINDSGEIIGTIACAMAAAGEGHLRGMAVCPEQQGTGVADKLLRHAEAVLRTLGCDRVTLDTTEPLTRAVRFYARHGFSPTGSVRDFFGMNLFEYAKGL